MNPLPSVSPKALEAELADGKSISFLDVREPVEVEFSALPGNLHIPLGELGSRASELNIEGDWVVICRSGMRSANATAYLIQLGFPKVRNLESGMMGWAKEVDSTIQVY